MSSLFATNDIVETKLGEGIIVEVNRDNDFVKVELNWKLANNQKAYLYILKSELNNSQATAARSSQNGQKAAFMEYFRVLWPAILCVFVDFLGLAIAST